ncbi:MAG: hypothetical protein ACWA5L_02890 [bacterium]
MGYLDFNDLSPIAGQPDREAFLESLSTEALNAGMTIGRAQVDWSVLETSKGVYDEVALREQLDYATRNGLKPYVTFSTLDSFGPTLPSYLMDPDGTIRDDLDLDSQEVLDGLKDFLDWFVPILTEYQVWGVSVANEPDSPIEDNQFTISESLTFFTTAMSHIKSIDPDIAVTLTFSGTSKDTLPGFTREIILASDIVAINYYCLKPDMLVGTPGDWAAELGSWMQAARGKEIFIQELGCPVGYGDDGGGAPIRPPNGIMGSPQVQIDFIEYVMGQFILHDQLRAATWFTIYDFEPSLAQAIGDAVRTQPPGSDPTADRLEEWLATGGLCRWADATCRDGWDSYLQGLQELKAARQG